MDVKKEMAFIDMTSGWITKIHFIWHSPGKHPNKLLLKCDLLD